MARRQNEMTSEFSARPDYIAFGSEQHRALLGLDDELLRAKERAAKEKQLAMMPAPSAPAHKRPVTEQNYMPTTRYEYGDEVVDGWTRIGPV
jgi:hypothetical protein